MSTFKKLFLALGVSALLFAGTVFAAEAQENDDEAAEMQAEAESDAESGEADVSAAVDPTTAQWSYQFAYQQTPDWHDDIMTNGQVRPEGLDNFFQFRLIAPFVFDSWTLLPRLTFRHYEAPNGESGIGNTEIFGLIIPKSWDWGSGRFGIGPLITLPGDSNVARDEWGYGVAVALVNGSGNWFYGVLATQTWRAIETINPPIDQDDTNPFGLAPILNYQLGGGWYLSNGDMTIQYDWNAKEFYVPIAVRIGKVLGAKKGAWNLYFEYQTSLVYEDWLGAAQKNTWRINVTRQLPAG